MIDREKAIQHFEDAIEASDSNDKWVFVRVDILEDAITLLKADQTYLQERDEKIKKLHLLLNAKLSAQPLVQKLTERLQRIADIAGDYDNYPTRNGLEWVCIEIQEIAMHGLQEVKNEDTEDAGQESGQEV